MSAADADTAAGAMRVLVTGGGGFLGRHIIDLCLARGWQVVSYQRADHPDLAARGVELRRGCLTDAAAVRAAMTGCAAVFHVAAKAGVWGPRREFAAANVTGTRNVLAAARALGVRRLVYTSTPSVVFSGDSFHGADASLPYGRNWLCHYARTKAVAEQMALAAHEPDGLRVCALRPHLIWGVGDPHLLPRVIAAARRGRLRMVGDGANLVDITHVRNAARAHLQAHDALAAGRCGGRAYFLSQGEPVRLWDWLNDLLRRLGVPPVTRRIPLRRAYAAGALAEALWTVLPLPGEPPMTRFVAIELAKSHWFSIAAARRDFGYDPEQQPTAAGVDEYVAAIAAAGGR
jgi:nucleoside-diphosphate-sugar epimerase